MFKVNGEKMSQHAIIAQGMKFDGVITCEKDLTIHGEGTGEIRSSSVVCIEKKGVFEGKVFAPKILIKGKMTGDLEAEEISIDSGGEVRGELTCKVLSIHTKGYFQGACNMEQENTPLSEEKKRPLNEPETDGVLL